MYTYLKCLTVTEMFDIFSMLQNIEMRIYEQKWFFFPPKIRFTDSYNPVFMANDL